MRKLLPILAITACVALTACASTPSASERLDDARRTAAIRDAVANPARTEKDRGIDAARRPVDVLQFSGIAPGQTVIDMFSAGGWYAELMAYTVGSSGRVYMQNPTSASMAEKTREERMAGNRLPNVIAWDRELNDLQLPPGMFDGAMLNLVFHDFYTLSTDVPGILSDLYAGLKPGAWVIVVDHSAPAGSRDSFATDPRGAHRIDEAFAKEVFLAAGFVLEGQLDIFRDASDSRQLAFFAPEMRGKTTDKFVLRFRKPVAR
jgi:predicted methyltransferase